MSYLIEQTETFRDWISSLRDLSGRIAILRRIDRVAHGNLGEIKPLGDGVSEMKIDKGPDYRVYYIRRGELVILLLAGGDKSSQERDIKRAKQLAREMSNEQGDHDV